MNEYCTIALNSPTPLVTAAIHDGHRLSKNLIPLSGLSDSERFREEDPFTGVWATLSKNQIIAKHSRFEFDLNRPPEKAIYLVPEDAWGLHVWKEQPSGSMLDHSLQTYHDIYARIKEGLSLLVQKFGTVVILDIHSYNYRREGPDGPPADPLLNPEVNLGTGTMDREYWGPLVDRFIKDLKGYEFMGRELDVRENVKFKGGYFPLWIHTNFKKSVCCISVEFKKFFMDEWSGIPDQKKIDGLREALKGTLPGLLEEASMPRNNPETGPRV